MAILSVKLKKYYTAIQRSKARTILQKVLSIEETEPQPYYINKITRVDVD
jgi:hypothetical protein